MFSLSPSAKPPPMLQQTILTLPARGPGLHEFTDQIATLVSRSRVRSGLAHVFCQHTSASLVIMENADPSARRDLEAWLERLVPADDPRFTHTLEGPDDMPSHIKMALTRSSETLPISDGRLLLGTWQGVFLWEHRSAPHSRRIVVTITGEGP
jgi:secondary thiamine-phosphate synthase enzyme